MDIVLIGAGNVATQLGFALNKHHNITQVFSRQLTNASLLAGRLNAKATDNIESISDSADIYLISVSDDAITPLIEKLPHTKGTVAHTAGSVSVDVLNRFENHGIFYPFQTFTKNRDISFNNIPILIDGDKESTTEQLLKLASSVTTNTYIVDSAQRLLLHIAAVFASNFTNHLYHISKTISNSADLPFDILQPLVEETVSKAFETAPESSQTGPASRDDRQTMQKHIEMLNSSFGDNNLAELYKNISKRIIGSRQP